MYGYRSVSQMRLSCKCALAANERRAGPERDSARCGTLVADQIGAGGLAVPRTGSPSEWGSMRKSRFSEEQIAGILSERKTGVSARELCRRHGISEQTFYRWMAKFGGEAPPTSQQVKILEDENRRLKKLLAEAMLDVATLRDIAGKHESDGCHTEREDGT